MSQNSDLAEIDSWKTVARVSVSLLFDFRFDLEEFIAGSVGRPMKNQYNAAVNRVDH